MKTKQLMIPLLVLGALSIPVKALAHMVETNYFLNDELEFQTTFSNGEPLKGADVMVYSPDNPTQPWAKGVTDSQGRFSFMPDENRSGEWEVTIRKQGHGDRLTIPVGENGVEFNQISQGESADVHYAIAPGWLAGIAIAGSAFLVARHRRQQG